jgi:hypothetical protein
MKNSCLSVLCGFVAATLLVRHQPAYAVEAFKKQFETKYVKQEPASDTEKAFAAAVANVKCNVCHVGKTKKVRNEYGKALNTLITKKDAKNLEKIQDALAKAAGMKSNPSDPNSPTFGELIEKGQLPGGEQPPAAAAIEETGN